MVLGVAILWAWGATVLLRLLGVQASHSTPHLERMKQKAPLEYEVLHQSDFYDDAVEQPLPARRCRRTTCMTTAGRHLRHRQCLFATCALLLFAVIVAVVLSGHRNNRGEREQQGLYELLVATPELIKSKHGTIASTFFAPDPPEDITCTGASFEGISKNDGYGCISDRLQNNEMMGRGTLLCSEGGRYSFGFGLDGSLVWRDYCRDGSERVYYRCQSSKDCAFVLTKNATFTVREMAVSGYIGKNVYEKSSRVQGISSNNCLVEPRYDCPYIHLHSSGKLVLHYVDQKGEFKQKTTDKVYSFD